MKVKTLAIDIAKSVFQLFGTDANHKPVYIKKVTRTQLLQRIIKLGPDEVVMEACGSSNYWARLLQGQGLKVRLLPPQHVKPFVLGNKNDTRDAQGILEASLRPHIRAVPIKTSDHQALQLIHRLREQQVRFRTALINQLHGLLLEFGYALPQTTGAFRIAVRDLLDEAQHDIPLILVPAIHQQLEQWQLYDLQIKGYEKQIKQWVKRAPDAQRLLTLPGFGPIVASAILLDMGSPSLFANGRAYSASIGVVPRHRASGERMLMMGISKRGDTYVRKQLIHGARAWLAVAPKKHDDLSRWACNIAQRRGWNRAVVALANKLARIAWAMLARGKDYQAVVST